jgi:hypothetical protein
MAERRESVRTATQGRAMFYHPSSGRELPGRTINVSRGGLWMYVPPHAPLRRGQEIQFLELPEMAGGRADEQAASASRARPLPATILRVDRATLVSAGRISVAVRFGPAPA